MRASDSPISKSRDTSTVRRLIVTTIAATAFIVAVTGVLLLPLVLGRLFAAEGDYSRISDIGQAYGAASAVISAITLGVLVLGQYKQARHARLQARFFQSEVPRLYWWIHGSWQNSGHWRMPVLPNRRSRFVVMVNEEYLRALQAGPPSQTCRDHTGPTG